MECKVVRGVLKGMRATLEEIWMQRAGQSARFRISEICGFESLINGVQKNGVSGLLCERGDFGLAGKGLKEF